MLEDINSLVGAKRSSKGGVPQKYFLDDYGRQLIVETYDSTSESIDTLAKKLKVPRRTISEWAAKLGVTRHSSRRWTEKEIEYLKKNFYKKDTAEIAVYLSRSVNSVHIKARKLGITEIKGYNMIDVRMGLGASKKSIDKWIKLGWLKGNKKRDTPNDHWDFSEKNIRDFIIAHPDEINPKLMDWLWVVDILSGYGLGRLDEDKYQRKEEE